MYRNLMTLFVLLLCACNQATKDKKDNRDSSVDTKPTIPQPGSDISGCYLRVIERDTLAARLEQNGDLVSGKLSFDNYQRDGSSGSVKGTVEGNLIKLVYRFHSEGMNSVAEVYFRIVDGGLVHGIGEVGVKGDSSFYKNKDSIGYDLSKKLDRVNCKELPDKYK